MKLEKLLRIPASLEKVRSALTDIPYLASYMPELIITSPIASFGQRAITAKFDEMSDKFVQSFIWRFKDSNHCYEPTISRERE